MRVESSSLIDRSARLDVSGVDFESFGAHPLEPGALRCIRYMHDVESHTMCYLRELLVTRAHRDPEMTAFLSCWCYEEHWHGDALGRVLEAHGEAGGAARVAEMRARLPRSDSWRPLLFGAGSALTTHALAVYMSWGAVNELTTQSAYGMLSRRAGHPVLSELLRRIMRQEGRHIDFYMAQAARRLGASSAARRVTRAALSLLWAPVGSKVMPPEETAFLARYLFGGPGGAEAARRVDRQLARLPGMEGLNPLQRALARQLKQAPTKRGSVAA